jgi:O-antigen/teichoic acid export membrane protein
MIKRLLKNTGSNVLVLIVKVIITFVMTPVFLHNMGAYDYGVWAIIASIIGYMGILDLGIKPAITRFTAKYEAENDKKALKTMYSSACVFTAIMGLLLCCILIIWGVFFPETLAPEGGETTQYTLVLLILAGQMLFMFPGYVPESFLEGFQQYQLKNNITIFNSIVGAIILYNFITSVNALYLLALINALGISIKYVAYFMIMRRQEYNCLTPKLKYISFKEIKNLLTFGGKSFIQGVAYQVESVTDVLVIGAFLGPAAVPLYSIPANLIAYIRNIGFTLTHAFMPQFSVLFANNDKTSIVALYVNASKWLIFLMLPVSILAVFFGPSFISLWLGDEYGEKSQIILLLLVIFTMVPFLDPFKSRYLTAINKHAILAKLFPISAAINLLVSIALVESLGIVGVAIGSIVPVMIFMPIYLHYSCKQLGISVFYYVKMAILPTIFPSVILGISSYLTLDAVIINDFYQLFFYSVLNFLFYILMVLLVLNKNERLFLKTKLLKRTLSIKKS